MTSTVDFFRLSYWFLHKSTPVMRTTLRKEKEHPSLFFRDFFKETLDCSLKSICISRRDGTDIRHLEITDEDRENEGELLLKKMKELASEIVWDNLQQNNERAVFTEYRQRQSRKLFNVTSSPLGSHMVLVKIKSLKHDEVWEIETPRLPGPIENTGEKLFLDMAAKKYKKTILKMIGKYISGEVGSSFIVTNNFRNIRTLK